jgi:hypothetical protein
MAPTVLLVALARFLTEIVFKYHLEYSMIQKVEPLGWGGAIYTAIRIGKFDPEKSIFYAVIRHVPELIRPLF